MSRCLYIHALALMRARLGNKCKILPGSIVDSQQGQAPGAPAKGCGANQSLASLKSHARIGTGGYRQAVNLKPADIGDSETNTALGHFDPTLTMASALVRDVVGGRWQLMRWMHASRGAGQLIMVRCWNIGFCPTALRNS